MNISIVLLFILFLKAITANLSDEDVLQKWHEFKLKYKKVSPRMEDPYRFEIFKNNLQKINEHNKLYENGVVSYKMGINKFADQTTEEFLEYRGLRPIKSARRPRFFLKNLSINELPSRVDWRQQGAVTNVKDQGFCGSCWSFSATGALEGQYFRKTGTLVSLSEQNLMDCSTFYGNNGCRGGLMDYAFNYVIDNGIYSEEAYPYEGRDYFCRPSNDTIVLKAAGIVDIESRNETYLQAAVATVGPISIAVDATFWQHYEEGVYFDSYCSDFFLNHGVLAVGYGTEENGAQYWIIKNSWGEDWGENGYIKLSRNSNNQCGVATMPSYPIL